MRVSQQIALLIGLIVLSCGCRKDPVTPPEPTSFTNDTTYVSSVVQEPDQKVVLIEEFTGVYCYTCPLAHDIVADMKAKYPERIAVLNIHSHFFGIYDEPGVMGNQYDFRTEAGDSIVSLLGGIVSVPSAAIDRLAFGSEAGAISAQRANWESYVDEEIAVPSPLNISITRDYNSALRKLDLMVRLDYTHTVSSPCRLSLAIAENGILDKQLVDSAVVDNYSHEHILRDCITDFDGLLLGAVGTPGRVVVRLFTYTIPLEWKAENLRLLAFVHAGAPGMKVLQATDLPLLP